MMVRRCFAVLSALALALAACAPAAPAATPQATSPLAGQADLSGIKTYLMGKLVELKTNTGALKDVSVRYYDMAKAADFDYAALWGQRPEEAKAAVEAARAAWIASSPLYEQMEGIVAGTPSLAEYDVILDAGASGAEDPDNAVPFDLSLPDGRALPKPGNLFGVTESTLWGTFAEFTAQGVQPDFNGNGQIEFGEALPEANVLKAGTEALDRYVGELQAAAQAWEPTEADAFTALVVMVPTMSEYFASWKSSRFVAGEASAQRDFVAISRLSDIQDILGSLQVVHQNVSPLIKTIDPAQAEQIGQGLADLKAFVADVYAKEKSGQRFTAEEADLLGAEAQNRATAITGQIAQVAAQLNIKIEE
jgi:hypothetical protein